MSWKHLHFLLISFTILLVTASLSQAEDIELEKAKPCHLEQCQPPNCRCSGLKYPKPEFEGHENEIPQFITVTFDDAVTALNFARYEELFSDLINPDNCSARGTFFVCHEYTDYSKVNALYTEGHEIALHSVTHATGTDYWREANVDLLMREFGQQMDMLEAFAMVHKKHIHGMRLPYLQISGNSSFVAAKKLGLLYDSSWPTQKFKNPAMWPYTLDFRSVQDCQIQPCPDAVVAGMWVSPMVTWTDVEGFSCAMIDGCVFLPKDNVDDIFSWMLSNFKRHYDGTRAPFGMYLHAALFSRSENYFKAFKKFLKHVNELPDVYITTVSRVINYLTHPTLGKPFKGCLKRPHTDKCVPKSCALKKKPNDEIRYMTVCGKCPEVYPWLDNPLGKK